jgi:hypothetical protein
LFLFLGWYSAVVLTIAATPCAGALNNKIFV